MTLHLGLFGVKARPIDDHVWAQMETEWFANGPGKKELVREIFEGLSDGAGALTSSSESIEDGDPFDRVRMTRQPPLHTPFHYECSKRHTMPDVLVREFETNSGIHYGHCESCSRDFSDERWAYQEWDPADEPHGSFRPDGIPRRFAPAPTPYGNRHTVDERGIVHAEDASGAWTYDPRTGDVEIVARSGTDAHRAIGIAYGIRKKLDGRIPLTEADQREREMPAVSNALEVRFPPGSMLD